MSRDDWPNTSNVHEPNRLSRQSLYPAVMTVAQLLVCWRLLLLFNLSLCVHLLIYVTSAGGMNSGRAALTGAVIGLTLTSGVTTWMARKSDFSRLQLFMQPVRHLVPVLLMALLFAYGVIMRPEWVYVHFCISLVAGTVVAICTLNPALGAGLRLKTLWYAIFVVATLALLLRLIYLSYSPPLHITDEAWDLSWGISYVREGHVSDILMLGLNGNPTHYIPRIAVALGAWLQVFGIGLWQGRLFSVLLSFAVILLTSLTARNVYGTRAARWTCAAMFTSMVFILSWRIRHDVGLALALAAALWLYTEAEKRQRNGLHALAGIAAGLGMFAHYHALVFGPVLMVALYLPQAISKWRAHRQRLSRSTIAFALGLATGLLIVISIQVLPDMQAFLVYRPPRSPLTLHGLAREFSAHLSTYVGISPWETLLVATGLCLALVRRRSFDLTLTFLLLLGYVALAATTTLNVDYYFVPFLPVYGLLIGTGLSQQATNVRKKRLPEQLMAFVGACVLLPGLGNTLELPLRSLLDSRPVMRDVPAPAAWVLEHVPLDKTILGEHYYYLWLYPYRYASPEVPGYLPPDERAAIQLSTTEWDPHVWARFGIDVIIFDPTLASSGILQSVYDSDFLTTYGYIEVAQFPKDNTSVRIYQQLDAPDD